jgi:tyrosine-specific transport protein
MKKNISLLQAIAVLIGTIIGAGMLGIPYAIKTVGVVPGLVLLLLLGIAIVLTNLIFGEVVLSTDKKHQLVGYAEKYLGKTGKYIMLVLTLFSFYGALLAYIIGEGEVLSVLFGGGNFLWSILFALAGSLIIYFGLRLVKEFELFLTAILLAVILFICFKGLDSFSSANFTSNNWPLFFAPYGVIFFAMGGLSAIPQLKEVLKGQGKLVKRAICIGTTIPFIFYALFIVIVLGVTGVQTTSIATIGLGAVLGKTVLLAGNILAVFSMATSFLTIGLGLKMIFQTDLKLNHGLSWLLVVGLPLLIFILGLNNFVGVIGTVGALGGGLEGLLICLMFLRLKKLRERVPEYELPKSKLMVALLIAVFLIGAGTVLVSLF